MMLNETADVVNIEQLVVCLRWVSAKFKPEAHEEFRVESERLYRVISNAPSRLNLA